jgi:hypothetical protein
MKSLQEKKSFFTKRYIRSVLSTMGLTATAFWGPSFIGNKFVLAALVALLTATMASNIAFQCYQFPAMLSNDERFAGHEAVCISFMDGFGYLFSVPIFATLGQLVKTSHGWSSGWGMLTALFGTASFIMVKNMAPMLDLKNSSSEHRAVAH